MILNVQDHNGAGQLFANKYRREWEEIRQVLEEMPLHLKSSDQAGIKGTAIFDPVGSNEHIKKHLAKSSWRSNIPVPKELAFLGTNIDFGKEGIIVEVQFSNYPFFLNNLLGSAVVAGVWKTRRR